MAVPLHQDPSCEDIWERDRTLDNAIDMMRGLPSAQIERMNNRQWIDFLCAQFDISRTSAKEMLHGMMRWKKEDNFKKMFNGGDGSIIRNCNIIKLLKYISYLTIH